MQTKTILISLLPIALATDSLTSVSAPVAPTGGPTVSADSTGGVHPPLGPGPVLGSSGIGSLLSMSPPASAPSPPSGNATALPTGGPHMPPSGPGRMPPPGGANHTDMSMPAGNATVTMGTLGTMTLTGSSATGTAAATAGSTGATTITTASGNGAIGSIGSELGLVGAVAWAVGAIML